jgi:hypothetical protein
MNPTASQRDRDALTEILIAVDIPLLGDERRKNWAKVVQNVDEQKASGWAFEGDFIAASTTKRAGAPGRAPSEMASRNCSVPNGGASNEWNGGPS